MDNEKRNQSDPKANEIVNRRTGETREQLMSKIPIPGPGRPKDTPEKKIEKKAIKQLVDKYRSNIAEALDKVSPVLIKQALKGNMMAIREINDIVGSHAPKKQDVTSDGEKIQPVLVRFLDNE